MKLLLGKHELAYVNMTYFLAHPVNVSVCASVDSNATGLSVCPFPL